MIVKGMPFCLTMVRCEGKHGTSTLMSMQLKEHGILQVHEDDETDLDEKPVHKINCGKFDAKQALDLAFCKEAQVYLCDLPDQQGEKII